MKKSKQFALIKVWNSLVGVELVEISKWFSNGHAQLKYETPFYEFLPIKVFSEEEALQANIKLSDVCKERNRVVVDADKKLKEEILEIFPELEKEEFKHLGGYTY